MMIPAPVCILGGTFNPIHMGHLQMARAAQAQSMADQVWFLPAGNPWQKQQQHLLDVEHRIRLIELAISGVHSWRVERLEADREGPSYTTDTLETLCDMHPDKRFSFIIGADQLSNLTSWKHWESLFDFARIGVVDRPPFDTFKIPEVLKRHFMHDRIYRIPMPLMPISSTEIRHHFNLLHSPNTAERQTALTFLETWLPAPVFRYLNNNSLYN